MYFLSYLLEIINIWFKVEINFEFTISRHSLQLVYRLGPSREIMWFWAVILFENFAASIIWFDFCLINNIISLCNSSLKVMKLPFQLEELSPTFTERPCNPSVWRRNKDHLPMQISWRTQPILDLVTESSRVKLSMKLDKKMY